MDFSFYKCNTRFDLEYSFHRRIIIYYLWKIGNNQLNQLAWNLCNESFRGIFCIRFPPQDIAVSCIHTAARILSISLPSGFENSWNHCFDVSSDTVEGMTIV